MSTDAKANPGKIQISDLGLHIHSFLSNQNNPAVDPFRASCDGALVIIKREINWLQNQTIPSLIFRQYLRQMRELRDLLQPPTDLTNKIFTVSEALQTEAERIRKDCWRANRQKSLLDKYFIDAVLSGILIGSTGLLLMAFSSNALIWGSLLLAPIVLTLAIGLEHWYRTNVSAFHRDFTLRLNRIINECDSLVKSIASVKIGDRLSEMDSRNTLAISSK